MANDVQDTTEHPAIPLSARGSTVYAQEGACPRSVAASQGNNQHWMHDSYAKYRQTYP